MNQQVTAVKLALLILLVGAVVVAASFLVPWKQITWGRLKLLPGDTITVVGEAKTKQQNQKATFSAGVSTVSDNKDTAIAEVNNKTQAIIDAVKTFGVPVDQIKTQNLNVYQSEESYYDEGIQKSRPGQWRVSNTVEITINDVNRAQGLADILTQSGANNIYGPNFALDDTGSAEIGLIEEAVNNAREKAVKVASVTGRKLGKMVGFTEGYQPQPVYFEGGGGMGGGGGIEPGTGTVTKTVTVTYELSP